MPLDEKIIQFESGEDLRFIEERDGFIVFEQNGKSINPYASLWLSCYLTEKSLIKITGQSLTEQEIIENATEMYKDTIDEINGVYTGDLEEMPPEVASAYILVNQYHRNNRKRLN